jgi:phosphoribosylformylglycinamidine cyclo-ligase
MVHCSGGGQTKVLHFVKSHQIIKDNLFETPPLFAAIQEATNMAWHEMYQVFNMGHRLEVFVSEQATAQRMIDFAAGFGIAAKVIGRVTDQVGTGLTIKSAHGTFQY